MNRATTLAAGLLLSFMVPLLVACGSGGDSKPKVREPDLSPEPSAEEPEPGTVQLKFGHP